MLLSFKLSQNRIFSEYDRDGVNPIYHLDIRSAYGNSQYYSNTMCIFHVRYVKRQKFFLRYISEKIFIFPFDWFFPVVIHLWCWWSAHIFTIISVWGDHHIFRAFSRSVLKINEYKWCHTTQNHKLWHFHFSGLFISISWHLNILLHIVWGAIYSKSKTMRPWNGLKNWCMAI